MLPGNSQFRVSEGIQKGCLYVATPSQSLCRKKLIKCPVPWASVLDETSHQENGFQVESAPIASTPRPATFIWVHNHTAVQRIIKSLQSIFKKKIRYSVSGKLGKRVCDAWPTPLSRQAMVWFAPIYIATTPNNPKLKQKLTVPSQCLTLITIFRANPLLPELNPNQYCLTPCSKPKRLVILAKLQLCKLLEVS